MATPSEPTPRPHEREDDPQGAQSSRATGPAHDAAPADPSDSAEVESSESATMPGGDGASASLVVEARDPNAGVRPGSVVGRYVVVSRVGSGGMGVVFAAYDPELDRKVAIKVLLHAGPIPDRGTATSSEAFREAQALAKLSHPNVVAVHDVGTTERGRVWLAMEFVGGQTLTQWLRARPRSWREVVEVLHQAALGLAAAHAGGVVHHDVKPDNVMIDEDERGRVERVRVMDFGLAHRGDGTLATGRSRDAARTDLPLQGTPAYMAPEQWSGETTDARTDQFSFCAMAWEAVHRQRAFAGEQAAAIASAVLAGEVRPPPPLPKVPRWLRGVLRRGLEVDRTRRHASMRALLDAIDRGRVGARRRLRAAAVVLVAAGVGAGLGARAWHRAHQAQRCAAEATAIESSWNPEISAQLQRAFAEDNSASGEDTAARVVLWISRHTEAWTDVATQVCVANRVEHTLDDELLGRARWCLQETRADLDDALFQFIRGSTRARGSAVRTAASLGDVAHCRDRRALSRAPAPMADEVDEVIAIRAMLGTARASFANHDRDGAIAIVEAATLRASTLGWAPLTAKVQLRHAALLEDLGRFAEAEDQAVESYFTAARGGADDIAFAAADWLSFIVGVRLGRPAEGVRWARQAELLIAPEDTSSLRRADSLSTRGSIELQALRSAEAEALHQEAFEIRETLLGPDHPNTASSINNLASAVYQRGDIDRARPLFEDACARLERALGAASPDVGVCLVNFATLLSASDGARSIAVYREAIGKLELGLGVGHPSVASARSNLGLALMREKQPSEARAELQHALEIYERTLGEQHPQVAGTLEGMATMAYRQGDHADAIALGERLLALVERTQGGPGGNRGSVLVARWLLARSRAATGGDEVAHRAAVTALREWFDSDEGRSDPRREAHIEELDQLAVAPAP